MNERVKKTLTVFIRHIPTFGCRKNRNRIQLQLCKHRVDQEMHFLSLHSLIFLFLSFSAWLQIDACVYRPLIIINNGELFGTIEKFTHYWWKNNRRLFWWGNLISHLHFSLLSLFLKTFTGRNRNDIGVFTWQTTILWDVIFIKTNFKIVYRKSIFLCLLW